MANRRTRPKRRAAAIVELAVCLPVLILIILGSIESCNYIFLKQALTEAAYQGSLAAIKPGATSSDVRDSIQGILDARNISSTTITIANGQYSILSSGDEFAITVEAQTSTNRVVPHVVAGLNSVESTTTAIKQ